MRILALGRENTAIPTGGLGVHCQELYSQMSLRGHEIMYCGFGNYDSELGTYEVGKNYSRKVPIKKLRPKRGEFAVCAFSLETDFVCDNLMVAQLITNEIMIKCIVGLFKNVKFDVIHIHDFHIYRAAKVLQQLYKVPVVMTLHLSQVIWHLPYIAGDQARHFAQQELVSIQGSDKLITVSNYYKKALDEMWIREDVSVIPNGVDYERFNKVKLEPAKNKTVVLVGRLAEQKGISLMYKAIRELKGIDFKIIANVHEDTLETDYVKEFKKIIEENDNVEWFYNIKEDEKLAIMKTATIAIMPSIHESFGMVALEWMALGIPLIVSRIEGLNDFCNDTNSIGLEPTADNIIKAIKKFRKDDSKIKAGKKTAQEYDWSKCAAKVEKVLEGKDV